ncbi:hypothetical protein M8J77_017453 [Diaphorina citri]|nr:hypothetical protein M8J77_017453 [Diaphorina citri]
MKLVWVSPFYLLAPYLRILICGSIVIAIITLLETVTDLPAMNGNELEDFTLAPPSPPQFKTENSSIIMAQTGSTAFIPCLVTNLGEGTVSLRIEGLQERSLKQEGP